MTVIGIILLVWTNYPGSTSVDGGTPLRNLILRLITNESILFSKIDQTRSLFVYFCSFHTTNTITVNDKSFDSVLGTQTRGGRMVGADESTELLRHPLHTLDLYDFRSWMRRRTHSSTTYSKWLLCMRGCGCHW